MILYMQVYDFCDGVSKKTTADGLIDKLAEDIDFIQQGLLKSFNEFGIDQRQEYITYMQWVIWTRYVMTIDGTRREYKEW